jgi:LysR family hydrogen peroxide-inducible transcriptional activator
MTLTELRYIVAVARERHFGRAAEACFVSQPTLSVAVRKLEEELGVTLFERGTGEVSVTPIGTRVIEQAQRVLEQAAVVKELAKQGKDPLSGPLRLGVIFTIGPYLLPELVPGLKKRAPRMPLVLQEQYTHRLVELLRQGELDAAILALPFESAGLVVQPLYDEPFVVAVPRGHEWSARRSVSTRELKDEHMLLLGTGHCLRDQVLEVCPELNRFSASADGIQKAFEGSSLETIRHMVASGTGITVLPVTAAARGAKRDRLLAYVPFAKPVPDRRIVLTYRKTFPRPEALQIVKQAVLNCDLSGVEMLDLAPEPG